jgi:hypothetical protein
LRDHRIVNDIEITRAPKAPAPAPTRCLFAPSAPRRTAGASPRILEIAGVMHDSLPAPGHRPTGELLPPPGLGAGLRIPVGGPPIAGRRSPDGPGLGPHGGWNQCGAYRSRWPGRQGDPIFSCPPPWRNNRIEASQPHRCSFSRPPSLCVQKRDAHCRGARPSSGEAAEAPSPGDVPTPSGPVAGRVGDRKSHATVNQSLTHRGREAGTFRAHCVLGSRHPARIKRGRHYPTRFPARHRLI